MLRQFIESNQTEITKLKQAHETLQHESGGQDEDIADLKKDLTSKINMLVKEISKLGGMATAYSLHITNLEWTLINRLLINRPIQKHNLVSHAIRSFSRGLY